MILVTLVNYIFHVILRKKRSCDILVLIARVENIFSVPKKLRYVYMYRYSKIFLSENVSFDCCLVTRGIACKNTNSQLVSKKKPPLSVVLGSLEYRREEVEKARKTVG